LSGAWVFKDTRLPVSTVFDNLEDDRLLTALVHWRVVQELKASPNERAGCDRAKQ